jgi:CubicO group peptidase (beta-lactamase class C family)
MTLDDERFKAELPLSVYDTLKFIVDEEARKSRIPGLSTAIVHDQEIIWTYSYGYADVKRNIPTSPQTIFAIGSITKLVTAIMMMRLRDEGKLGLDDPVEKYLPSIKIRSSSNNGRPVTLRQISSHTAGLQREVSAEGWNTLKFPTIEQLLESLREVTTVFPPFSRYKYSNLGYTILGHVLSIVAGISYKEYVMSNILEPLGMIHSGFDITEEMKENLAVGYTVFGEDPIDTVPYLDLQAMTPAGQLYSSVADISKLISFQFIEDPLTTGNGPARLENDRYRAILEAATIREMHSPVYIGKKWVGGTGIGWHITNMMGHTISSHRGGIPGFTTDIVLVRDIKLGIAVFTNAFPQPNEIAVRLLQSLVPYFETFAAIKNDLEDRDKEHLISLEKYSGRYHSKYYGDIEIRQSDGRLILVDPLAPSGLQIVLIPIAPDRFIMSGGDEDGESASFETNEDGSVKAVNTAGYRFEFLKKP